METKVKDSINNITLSEWKDIAEGHISVKIEGITNYDELCLRLQEIDSFTKFDINTTLFTNLQRMEDKETFYGLVIFGEYGNIVWDW